MNNPFIQEVANTHTKNMNDTKLIARTFKNVSIITSKFYNNEHNAFQT